MNVERLKELAQILYRVARDPNSYYNQCRFFSGNEMSCATPACALGYWAHEHKDRWTMLISPWDSVTLIPRLNATLAQQPERSPLEDAQIEFELTEEEAEFLFDGDGCGRAYLPEQAAQFIEMFADGDIAPGDDVNYDEDGY